MNNNDFKSDLEFRVVWVVSRLAIGGDVLGSLDRLILLPSTEYLIGN